MFYHSLYPRTSVVWWTNRILISVCFSIALLGCVPHSKELSALSLPTTPPIRMEAVPVGRVAIDSIEVQLLGTFPMHATVIARGHLPNDCTELKPINPYFDVSTFKVSIFMARVMSNTCRNTLRPFESVIPLNIKGLRAGVYTVNVNGVIGNFRLSADNGIR